MSTQYVCVEPASNGHAMLVGEIRYTDIFGNERIVHPYTVVCGLSFGEEHNRRHIPIYRRAKIVKYL